MNNRIVTLIVVVLIGIVIGVGVVNISNTNNRASKPQESSSMIGQQLGMIISSQGAMNEKLTKLEEKQSNILKIFEETKQTAMRMQQQIPQGQQAPQGPGCGGGPGQQGQQPPE